MTEFEKVVAQYGPTLMADFALTADDAAAVFGNLGHETGGFKYWQELSPTVPGSAGGFGWAQWTGPRRRAFEAYCKRNRLDPRDHAANYAFLFTELKGDEAAAIPAVKKASGLENKVVAFERAFERAGIKHYPSRIIWAQKALAVLRFEAPITSDDLPPVFTGGDWPVAVFVLIGIGIIALAALRFMGVW